MTSRLSSLLVRDGLVRVHRMEHVFQRQVIHGGTLDTILLEMGLVEGPRLQQYLSLATGLPPAHAEPLEPDEALLKVCTQEIANAHKVAPVKLEDGALEVLVCDPVDVETLESLANTLDVRVQPMVVPEYQFQLALAKLYGQEVGERFSRLAAAHIQSGSNGAAIKQVPVVTIGERTITAVNIDDDNPDAVPHEIRSEITQPADTRERVRGKRPPAEQPARRMTMELNTDSLREHVMATKAMAADTPKIVVDTPAVEAPELSAELPARGSQDDDTSKTVEMSAAEMPAMDSGPAAAEASTAEASTAEPAQRAEKAEAQLFAAISADEARAMLDLSEDRDEIFIILLRAMRKHARHVALFTLKGSAATGRIALSKAGFDDEEIREISVDLGPDSRFQKVATSKAFSVGPLTASDAGVCAALEKLGGGEIPKSALLLPIVVRDRVIAIAVAHNRDRGINVGRVTELLPLGTATADAVNRLLAKLRAQASSAGSGSEAAIVATQMAASPSAPIAGQSLARAASPSESSTLPIASAAMIELFSRLESDDRQVFEDACTEAIAKSDEAIEHLRFCFPGKLVRPRESSTERLKAAEHGPILDLITRIGAPCGTALSEKMSDADREVRYYATLCAAEIRPPEVLNELVERLFDTDEKIRELAVEALRGYPSEERSKALDFARRALHSEDNGRVKVAADGLTKLADTSAIPDLIDAHSRGGDAASVSRSALFQLSAQDFGNSTRKWRSWWEKNQERHPIEWMLDGLNSKSAEVRQHACEVLRSMSGEYFGYGHDLPKKERDKTRQLWMDWWNKSGKERFS